jgi:dihydropteroate synthase
MLNCTVNGIRIGPESPVRLAGVINCSHESFFSGSYVPSDMVRERSFQMIDNGADIIDIGARSTAPGTPPVSELTEKRRMEKALCELDGSGITVSVDTAIPSVLETCLKHDIHLVNDIGGLANENFAGVVSDSGLPAILMASRSGPGDARGFDETMNALAEVVRRCEVHSVREFILDPAIGLWTPERTVEMDWELSRKFKEFTSFKRPLLAAVSRKTFLGAISGQPPEERLPATLGLTALLIYAGADLVRSHDVKETADVIRVVSQFSRRF